MEKIVQIIWFMSVGCLICLASEDQNAQVHVRAQVPSKPRIIHVYNIMSTSFYVNWEAPKETNGNLIRYELQLTVTHDNSVRTKIIEGGFNDPMVDYISNLEPYTMYQLSVRAVTNGGAGEYSDTYPVITDVTGPGAPSLLNYTIMGPDSVYLTWARPDRESIYKEVNNYLIYFRDTEFNSSKEVTVNGSVRETIVEGLPTNREYKMKIAGATNSLFTSKLYVGLFTEPVIIRLHGEENTTATDVQLVRNKVENIYASGCVGEKIDLQCPESHKIAIKRIFNGVKTDQRCHEIGRRHSDACCQRSRGDCLVTDDKQFQHLNMLCSGYQRCQVKVTRVETSSRRCESETSDYMTLMYDCIADADSLEFCSNAEKHGTKVYLSNADFPSPIPSGDSPCRCVVTSDFSTGVSINAIDVLITKEETSSECNQTIVIQDNSGNRKEIACGLYGIHGYRRIFDSRANNVSITLHNSSTKRNGYIWMQVKTQIRDGNVSIRCGDAMSRVVSTTTMTPHSDGPEVIPDIEWITIGVTVGFIAVIIGIFIIINQ